jgi:nicotinamide mononucleotide adenylyltransferase
MLLCGADLLATMAEPGVWKNPDVILQEHGVVVVTREGSQVQEVLSTPGTVLHQFRDKVLVVEEPVPNGISSTRVREAVAAGRSVKYLLPDSVFAYIRQHGLYHTP